MFISRYAQKQAPDVRCWMTSYGGLAYISTPTSMSTAMVTLNCLIYESKPALSRIFTVKIDPGEVVGELRTSIWQQMPSLHATRDIDSVDLYTPKSTISTASKTEFNYAFENLDLVTQDERNSSLEELNPTSYVGDYPCLKEAARKQLHIIVFFEVGRFR
jgi:Crinkler effector protein N-terminal domain